jgi:HK97 family phage major capsid protein
MDNDALKLALREVFTEKDAEIKQHIEELAGPLFAEKIAEAVKEARAREVVSGKGIDVEAKKKFIDDVKLIARGEKAAYLTVNDQTGGYLVPTEVHGEIMRIAETTGIVARDARNMGVADIEIPIYTGDVMQGTYVSEDGTTAETQNDLGVARLKAASWMTIVRLSNKLISKANVNVADWLMALVAEGLAYRLDREGFVGGTFAGSPFVGLLGSTAVTKQTLGNGLTGFEDITPEEAAIAIGTLPTSALDRAAFYFHRTVWARIKTQRIGAPGTAFVFNQDNSALATLRRESGIQPVGEIQGYPVFTTDVLPAYSTSGISKKFGVFGNLNLALVRGEDGPMSVLRSENAVVGGVSVYERNQTAMRFTQDHALSIMLPEAAVVFETAAG